MYKIISAVLRFTTVLL